MEPWEQQDLKGALEPPALRGGQEPVVHRVSLDSPDPKARLEVQASPVHREEQETLGGLDLRDKLVSLDQEDHWVSLGSQDLKDHKVSQALLVCQDPLEQLVDPDPWVLRASQAGQAPEDPVEV